MRLALDFPEIAVSRSEAAVTAFIRTFGKFWLPCPIEGLRLP
jgi:hypothetical protein